MKILDTILTALIVVWCCLVIWLFTSLFAHCIYRAVPDPETWLTWALVAYVTLTIRLGEKSK